MDKAIQVKSSPPDLYQGSCEQNQILDHYFLNQHRDRNPRLWGPDSGKH